MLVEVPEADDVLARMAGVQSTFAGETRTIAEWRREYVERVASAREGSPIEVFKRFVGGGLLERAMSGEAYERRMEGFPSFFQSYDDVTEDRVRQFLAAVGYRFPEAGLVVVMKAKEIVTSPGFCWLSYFEDAEGKYRDEFRDDAFLRIKGVSYKTRDLALSEFSKLFVAVDLHVTRVMARTGLLVHGYGDPAITTNQQTPDGYLFLHRLTLKLSESTGWPQGGYSPGEIDRVFWHFGRTMCKKRPRRSQCPVGDVCLTGDLRPPQ